MPELTVTLALPDEQMKRLEHIAVEQQVTIDELLLRSVNALLEGEPAEAVVLPDKRSIKPPRLTTQQREAIAKEKVQYRGEYIAIHEGKIIAHSRDLLELIQELSAIHGLSKSEVLFEKVAPREPDTWRIFSPRLAK